MKEWAQDQKSESGVHSHLKMEWPSPFTWHKGAGMDENARMWGLKKILIRSNRKPDPHIDQVKTYFHSRPSTP